MVICRDNLTPEAGILLPEHNVPGIFSSFLDLLEKLASEWSEVLCLCLHVPCLFKDRTESYTIASNLREGKTQTTVLYWYWLFEQNNQHP